jgi:hypothetical protein
MFCATYVLVTIATSLCITNPGVRLEWQTHTHLRQTVGKHPLQLRLRETFPAVRSAQYRHGILRGENSRAGG